MPQSGPRKYKLFSPILAGASLSERLWACLGALVGIGVTGFICALIFGHGNQMPLIVAPVGASAVLVFAVPASPLAQPWSVIGGNTISALMGVIAARLVPDPSYAIGLAVCLAILAMSFTRSLHPPGGAAALTAVIGGAAIKDLGFLFPLIPVAINSIALVSVGYLFHRFSRHSYPHRPTKPLPSHGTSDRPPAVRVGFVAEDIDGALSDLHETLDIDRNDIDTLVRQVEQRALNRTHGDVKCFDVMSQDIVSVDVHASEDTVRTLLLRHDLRTLPVVNGDNKLVGLVGYRELEQKADDGRFLLSQAVTASADDPAISLLPLLTSGSTHNVMIVDSTHQIVGVVSQTDLLVALGKNLLRHIPV